MKISRRIVELCANAAVIASLLYVPIHQCNGVLCESGHRWMLIWDFNGGNGFTIDLSFLVVQASVLTALGVGISRCFRK